MDGAGGQATFRRAEKEEGAATRLAVTNRTSRQPTFPEIDINISRTVRMLVLVLVLALALLRSTGTNTSTDTNVVLVK